MAGEKIPDSWEGRRIEALIMQVGGGDSMGIGRRLFAYAETGTLEGVYEHGITATFDDEGYSAFYPWSAILRMRVAST